MKYFSNSTRRVESLSPPDKRSIFASAIDFADMNIVRPPNLIFSTSSSWDPSLQVMQSIAKVRLCPQLKLF